MTNERRTGCGPDPMCHEFYNHTEKQTRVTMLTIDTVDIMTLSSKTRDIRRS